MEGGYLIKEELVSLYGRTGNILHARNPFGKELYYQEYKTQIPSIMEKIRPERMRAGRASCQCGRAGPPASLGSVVGS
jgi:hypothetical protein